jgi:hypothetical protein
MAFDMVIPLGFMHFVLDNVSFDSSNRCELIELAACGGR